MRIQGRRRNGSFKLIIKLILIVFFVGIIFLLNLSMNRVNIKMDDLAALRISTQNILDIYSLSELNEIDFYEALAVFLMEENFFPEKTISATKEQIEKKLFNNYSKIKKKYANDKLLELTYIFKNIFGELTFFPIPKITESDSQNLYMYGDSWGTLREYGGKRIHQGTDIMDRENIRGRIPVVSMTDGVIENLGWNEKGGWRVGVRGNNGTYYYYAHLAKYSDSLEEGMKISAGHLLGFMGDSGYSKKKGTVGNFAVHLHVGIMPQTKLSSKEFWINPYPILKFIEDKKIEYTK